jgi:hypothetical protein
LVYVLPKSGTIYKDVSDGAECKPDQHATLVVKFVALQADRVEAAD